MIYEIGAVPILQMRKRNHGEVKYLSKVGLLVCGGDSSQFRLFRTERLQEASQAHFTACAHLLGEAVVTGSLSQVRKPRLRD